MPLPQGQGSFLPILGWFFLMGKDVLALKDIGSPILNTFFVLFKLNSSTIACRLGENDHS